ncbi:hypothetical protein TNCV_2308301 [Trichonephila clavipes]|nr:hypothetical protein TNCV_2308301 [Trichonephila clavipes]
MGAHPECTVGALPFPKGYLKCFLGFTKDVWVNIVMKIRYRLLLENLYSNCSETFDLSSARHRQRLFDDRRLL